MTHSFSVNWSVFVYICGDLYQQLEKQLSYRLLFIFLHSKEYISLRTDLKPSDSLELNSKVIDHGLN